MSQNLRRHITDKHPGKLFKRKGEGEIDTFFCKQKKPNENISSGSSSRPQSSLMNSLHSNTEFDIDRPSSSLLKEAGDDDVSVSFIMDNSENTGLKADEAFIYLREAVDDIKSTLGAKQSKQLPKIALPKELAPTDERLEGINECHYCEDIVENFAEIEEKIKEDKGGNIGHFFYL